MSNPLHQLRELGQSVWYDNIRRALLTSGELERYTRDYAVSGVTSNPTIFERAIAGGSDYDAALHDAAAGGTTDPEELFWQLAVQDIRAAADVLRDTWQATGGDDGYVCLELPPRLSRDTVGSVAMAQELDGRVDRPNVMIKVPGTPAGVPAIEELTARGVNVNVTLLFSVSQWRSVAEAYLAGLERRLEDGRDLDVASVASFFISRIDRKANDRLPERLHNRLGVANARLAYAAYRDLLGSQRWQALEQAGARPQRVLWASTSVKDPTLPEGYYVRALAAPGTVNTMPEDTMLAFARHGTVGEPLGADPGEAEEVTAAAERAGVKLEALGEELQEEGDQKFADSFDRLLACIEDKLAQLEAPPAPGSRLGPVDDEVEAVTDELVAADAVRRLWDHDHTLWQSDATEVTDRLGWLTSPERMEGQVDELGRFVKQARADGLTHTLVLGMGGSSLFPIVVRDALGGSNQGLQMHVLDSIDPRAVTRITEALPLASTLVVASSKSGKTTETRSLLAWFWDRSGDPAHFAVVTDPGTELGELARERGFRAVFEADPEIGGRYSALSPFGLVPAALAGVDIAGLLARAGRVAAGCAGCVDVADNPGVRLGAILAGAARAGRDKLTLVVGEGLESFGLWIEQLIAESTGKQGTGLVPVVDEPLGPPSVYGDDRLFVGIGVEEELFDELAQAGHPAVVLGVDEPVELGGQVLRWEIATALAGAALDINPFDQPDVEASKQATREALEEGVGPVRTEAPRPLLDTLEPGDYLAIQAYLDPAAEVLEDLQRVRAKLRDRHRVATTLGVGPRYLHSTGQLHKGGPNTGVFLQVVADHDTDPPVPGESFGLATLEQAQAAGDLRILRERGRRAARVTIADLLSLQEDQGR